MLGVELMISTGKRCFHVSQHGIHPGKQLILHESMATTGNDGCVMASCIFDAPETGQTIADGPDTLFQSVFCPLSNGFSLEVINGIGLHIDRVVISICLNCGYKGGLVL